MNIVVAVDWRDQSQSALQVVIDLYEPKELTLVHAVNLGPLESYPLAPLMDKEPYQEFENAKRRLMDETRQHLKQIAVRVQHDVPSVKQVCEAGGPVSVILEAIKSSATDLVVIGNRGLTQFAEFAMGSVSHLVLLHAACATLVVKGAQKTTQRVVVAVKGPDDAERIKTWLLAHPFKHPMELVVLNVVPSALFAPFQGQAGFDAWTQAATATAQRFVDPVAASLNGPHYAATGRVAIGDAADMIAREVGLSDLLVVSTHGRTGVHRLLFGSVSHSVVHRVSGSVLVVR
jgi:nucleotide-binding universal stress UspA family protein